MKSQQPSFLFISATLSRSLITLATSLQKQGIRAIIASPAKPEQTDKLRIRHIRLGQMRIFKKVFLFSTPELRHFIKQERIAGRLAPRIQKEQPESNRREKQLRVRVMDQPGLELARRLRLNFRDIPTEPVIDLSVFNPGSVASTLQARFLSELNIAPHQKLVTVISPLGLGLDVLLKALAMTPSEELVIALYGSAGRMRAQKIIRKVARTEQKHRVTFIGMDEDLATILRSSYAIMSLGGFDQSLLMSATAMGRPTIWQDDSCAIPNIKLMNSNSPAVISAALDRVLYLTAADRTRIEKGNVAAAKHFNAEHAVEALLCG